MRAEPLLAAAIVLALTLPAVAQDGWPSGDLSWPIPLADQSPAADATPPSSDPDAEGHAGAAARAGSGEAEDLRRFRIEITGRFAALTSSKFKVGVGEFARTVYPRADLGLPGILALGYRVVFDVQVTEQVLVGVYATHVLVRGPRRLTHHKPVGSFPRTLPPYSRGRSSVDIFVGEFFLRYIILDSDRFQFSYGLGAAAISYRFRFDGQGQRLAVRVETWFAPTISYLLQVRIAGPVHFYLESSLGLVSPARFPSYHSETRLGLRIALGGGLEWIVAVSSLSGQIQNLTELFGHSFSGGFRWKKAAYSILGGETGLAFRF